MNLSQKLIVVHFNVPESLFEGALELDTWSFSGAWSLVFRAFLLRRPHPIKPLLRRQIRLRPLPQRIARRHRRSQLKNISDIRLAQDIVAATRRCWPRQCWRSTD